MMWVLQGIPDTAGLVCAMRISSATVSSRSIERPYFCLPLLAVLCCCCSPAAARYMMWVLQGIPDMNALGVERMIRGLALLQVRVNVPDLDAGVVVHCVYLRGRGAMHRLGFRARVQGQGSGVWC
jgi:hypothetical protein